MGVKLGRWLLVSPEKLLSPLYEMVKRCDLRPAFFRHHITSLTFGVLVSDLPLLSAPTKPLKIGAHQSYRIGCHALSQQTTRLRTSWFQTVE